MAHPGHIHTYINTTTIERCIEYLKQPFLIHVYTFVDMFVSMGVEGRGLTCNNFKHKEIEQKKLMS